MKYVSSIMALQSFTIDCTVYGFTIYRKVTSSTTLPCDSYVWLGECVFCLATIVFVIGDTFFFTDECVCIACVIISVSVGCLSQSDFVVGFLPHLIHVQKISNPQNTHHIILLMLRIPFQNKSSIIYGSHLTTLPQNVNI